MLIEFSKCNSLIETIFGTRIRKVLHVGARHGDVVRGQRIPARVAKFYPEIKVDEVRPVTHWTNAIWGDAFYLKTLKINGSA